jgi:hypothetical protein
LVLISFWSKPAGEKGCWLAQAALKDAAGAHREFARAGDYYKGKNCKPTGFHTRKGNSTTNRWGSSFFQFLVALALQFMFLRSLQNGNDYGSGMLDFYDYEPN